MASKIASKTALALKLGLSTPGSPPGAHFDPLGPRFWSLRELIFEASFAPSQRPKKQARSPNKRWVQTARLVQGGRRCWRSHSQYNENPPTTACGATSVFETPSVLRESLPSYSAKPGAFYAPRALRWTTPPRGRTDPFQGPKIKPMFHRFSMLFQDDFGVENGGQNQEIRA